MSKHPNRSVMIRAVIGLVWFQAPGVAVAQGDEIPPTPTVIEIPDSQAEFSVGKGETMAARATIFTFRGIHLQSRIDGEQKGGSGAGRPSVAIEPQYLVARTEDKDWTYYAGNVQYKFAGVTDVTGELGSGGLQNRVGGLRIRKDDPNELEIWVRRHTGRGFYFEGAAEFEDATIGAGDELSEAKELVFEGMDGQTLLLTYKEHAGTAAEPVLQEPVSVDLSGNAEITVKGVRLEILAADADTLTFRVLQNFPQVD